MASVARAIQAVRPHVPMIKFPNRIDANIGAASSAVQSVVEPSSRPSPVSSIKSTNLAGSGLESVPLKYRRRLISPEEMAYIERGGPE